MTLALWDLVLPTIEGKDWVTRLPRLVPALELRVYTFLSIVHIKHNLPFILESGKHNSPNFAHSCHCLLQKRTWSWKAEPKVRLVPGKGC